MIDCWQLSSLTHGSSLVPTLGYANKKVWTFSPLALVGNSHHLISFWSEKVTQSCLTLCNPMDYTVHWILQARILEWIVFPISRRERKESISLLLEEEMTIHSSFLAWRIPWTEKLGGLLSRGPHRVRHDWNDLAATAAAVTFLLYPAQRRKG